MVIKLLVKFLLIIVIKGLIIINIIIVKIRVLIIGIKMFCKYSGIICFNFCLMYMFSYVVIIIGNMDVEYDIKCVGIFKNVIWVVVFLLVVVIRFG